MKTAISIPDKLFENVEKKAKQMGVTRSKIFALAAEEFLTNHNSEAMTRKLNEVYSKENSKLDRSLLTMQSMALGKGNGRKRQGVQRDRVGRLCH